MKSIVLSIDFEISLRMSAYRADFRSLCSDYDMTAVAAFPNLDFALSEHFLRLHIMKQRSVTLFVMFFDGCDSTEFSSEFRESFLFSSISKTGIHVSPLIVFTISGSTEIFSSSADSVQFLEPHFRVLFLIIGSLLEKSGNLLKAILFCLRSKIGVLVSCLRFACKSSLKILFSLCSCIRIGFLFCYQLQLVAFCMAEWALRLNTIFNLEYLTAYETLVSFHFLTGGKSGKGA